MRKIYRQSERARWVVPTIVMLLVMHLGRFYTEAPLALALCFEHNHAAAPMAMGHEDDHAHSHESAAVSADTHDDAQDEEGYALKHCKDTYRGINLIPVSVMSLPAEVFALGIVPEAKSPSGMAEFFYPELSASVFHPPQLLS